jgi:Rrf2 family protein
MFTRNPNFYPVQLSHIVSRKVKYAIRSALYLARHYGEGPVSVETISRAEGISLKFLETIMQELRKAGICYSRRGKRGGYALRRAPQNITLGQIIRLIDGPLAPVRCVSATAYAPCPDCPVEKGCNVRSVMKEVREAISKVLDLKTLEQTLRDCEKENSAATKEITFHI